METAHPCLGYGRPCGVLTTEPDLCLFCQASLAKAVASAKAKGQAAPTPAADGQEATQRAWEDTSALEALQHASERLEMANENGLAAIVRSVTALFVASRR